MIETLLVFLATAFAADAIQRQGGGWQQPPLETDDEYLKRLEKLYLQIRSEYLPEVLTRGKMADMAWQAAEKQLDSETKIDIWHGEEAIIHTPEMMYFMKLPRTSDWSDYILRATNSYGPSVTEHMRTKELVKWDAMMQAGEVPSDQPLPPGMEWTDFPIWDFKRHQPYMPPGIGWKKDMGYAIANPEAVSYDPRFIEIVMFGPHGPMVAVWHDESDHGDSIEIATAFAVDEGWDILVDQDEDDDIEVYQTESGPISSEYLNILFRVEAPWVQAYPKEPARPSGMNLNRSMDPAEALEMWMAYKIRSRRET